MLGVSDRFFPLTDRIHSATTVELSEAALAVDAGITKLCAGLSEELSLIHISRPVLL